MIRSVLLILLLCISSWGFAQNAYFYYNKGIAQMTYENNTEAIKAFTRAIELNDIIANAYANRGLSHHRLKEYGLAIADYQKAESLLPGLSSYNMACAYSLLGKSDDAFQWLTVCQKSDYKQSKEI